MNGWKNSAKSIPAINIQQNDEGFIVEVAAPGMTKEDVWSDLMRIKIW